MLLCRLLLLWQSTVAMVQMLWKHSVATDPLMLQNRHYGTFCCYKSIIAMVQLHGNLQLLWCKHVAKETTAAMVQTSVAMAIIHHYGAKFYCYSKRQ